MFETHSDYQKFAPLIKRMLEEKGRSNLVNLLEQPKTRKLFLHDVDHPVGYLDGPSGISIKRMERRAFSLSKKDRNKLYQIAEYAIRAVEDSNSNSSSEEKKELLLGANQLVQNADWVWSHGVGWRRKGKSQLERIAKTYVEGDSIANIKAWDAQIAENKGFYHISKGMDPKTMMFSMGGVVPTAIGTSMLFGVERAQNTIIPLFLMGAYSLYANNFLLLPLQDFFGEKKSPNTTSKLITGRHYNLLRHPMYASRMLANVCFGLGSFPFGTHASIKDLYHNVKGCEKQDERMRILHGKEAVEYQGKTPVMLPGSKLLVKGLRKILPEKVCDVLDTPVSHYLEKIPGIKDENYYTDEWVTSPGYSERNPSCHLGTPLERKARPNPNIEIGKALMEMPGDLAKLFSYIHKKSTRKLQRKLAYEAKQLASSYVSFL